MAKSSSLIWLVVTGYLPIFLMIGLYARVVYQLWFLDEDDGDSTRQASTGFFECFCFRGLAQNQARDNTMFFLFTD